MKTFFSCFAVAALAVMIPSAARAQFGYFGGMPGGYASPVGYGMPFGGASYGGVPFGGVPYGGIPYGGWGYGASPYGYPYFSGTVLTPVIYSVSTPVHDPPRVRPAVWPAIPYRPAATTAVDGAAASIDVRVPTASAQLWIDGTLMRQSGVARRFATPALEPGSVYTMEVRVSWQDAGGMNRVQAQRIEVRAGGQRSVDFTAAP